MSRTGMPDHPGHDIRVTGGGPFGRAWLDCSCGIDRVFASKRAATAAAFLHHHDVGGGCACPDWAVALDVHPTAPASTTEAAAGSTA